MTDWLTWAVILYCLSASLTGLGVVWVELLLEGLPEDGCDWLALCVTFLLGCAFAPVLWMLGVMVGAAWAVGRGER